MEPVLPQFREPSHLDQVLILFLDGYINIAEAVYLGMPLTWWTINPDLESTLDCEFYQA